MKKQIWIFICLLLINLGQLFSYEKSAEVILFGSEQSITSQSCIVYTKCTSDDIETILKENDYIEYEIKEIRKKLKRSPWTVLKELNDEEETEENEVNFLWLDKELKQEDFGNHFFMILNMSNNYATKQGIAEYKIANNVLIMRTIIINF